MKFDRRKFVLCMTDDGRYYFRHIKAPDEFRGNPIMKPDTLHNVIDQLLKKLGLRLPREKELLTLN